MLRAPWPWTPRSWPSSPAACARYPAAPPAVEAEIAAHACRKHSGRVGRTAAAKDFADEAIDLAVIAHVRHRCMRYEALLARGMARADARALVRAEVDATLVAWRGLTPGSSGAA